MRDETEKVMTTINQLKVAGGAGEPDSVLALRIDVIKASLEWSDAVHTSDFDKIYDAENKLLRAVYKYRAAIKRRSPVHLYSDAT